MLPVGWWLTCPSWSSRVRAVPLGPPCTQAGALQPRRGTGDAGTERASLTDVPFEEMELLGYEN